jgi:predicted tellurium resistance membrane protein TerC
MEILFDPQVWLAFLTLTALEIVLGIDNLVFIAILVGRLPEAQRERARLIGLALAMVMRILLLLSIYWVMGLNAVLFEVLEFAFSGRDLILISGGLFLMAKSTLEVHDALEGEQDDESSQTYATFKMVLVQIMTIDMVFSLDSVITAVGLAQNIEVMIAAIVVAVGVMMLSANAISRVVDSHPTLKMLALSFLMLIGVALVGEGLHFHIPKGYIYFAMAFSVLVETLNIKVRKRSREALRLRKRIRAQSTTQETAGGRSD